MDQLSFAALRPTRRSAIALLGASAIATTLAACSSITNNGQPQPGAVQPSKGASGAETLPLSKVPLGSSVAVTVNGHPAIVSQPTAGKVAAFSAICTHQGCVIAPASSGLEADCPCHGSKFDTATGKVLHGPANQPLDKVAATVSGGTITFPA